jgi:hypothetical protein
VNEVSDVQLLGQNTLRIVFPLLRLFRRRDIRHGFFLVIDDAIEKRCFSVVPYPRGKAQPPEVTISRYALSIILAYRMPSPITTFTFRPDTDSMGTARRTRV